MINKLIGGVAVLALVVAGVAVSKPAQVVERTIQVGAVSSPDIISPYFSFGGVRQWATHQSVAQATSTFCAMQSPAATTTLLRASVNLTFASSSAQNVVLTRASTQYATTTLLGQLSTPAGGQGVIVATTTTLTDGIVAPNSWITAGWTGALGDGTNSAPVGTCNAIFVEVN